MDSRELSSAPLRPGPSPQGPPRGAWPRSGKPGGRRNQVNRDRASAHPEGSDSPCGWQWAPVTALPRRSKGLHPGPCDVGQLSSRSFLG